MKRNQSYMMADEVIAIENYVKETAGDIVEIGTYKGGTSAVIAENMIQDRVLWAVDYYPGNGDYEYYECSLDLLEVTAPKHVYRVFGSSGAVGLYWNKPIGFLIIDGCHSYESMSLDFDLWSPWVTSEGVIAVHDGVDINGLSLDNRGVVGQWGVIQKVNEIKAQAEWEAIDEVGTIVFFKRAIHISNVEQNGED